MTLFELMIALAVAGLVVGALSTMVGRMRKSELRRDTGDVVAAVRSAFDRSAATGVHHRIVFDLERRQYRLERCEGRVRLQRGTDSRERGELTTVNDQLAQVTEQLKNLTSGDAAMEAQETVKQAVGTAQCVALDGKKGETRTLRGANEFAKIHASHLEEPAEDGEVSLHFFPLGYGQKAAIELADDDDGEMTIVIHPLTGQVEVMGGGIDDLEDFVHEDAEGEEVEP